MSEEEKVYRNKSNQSYYLVMMQGNPAGVFPTVGAKNKFIKDLVELVEYEGNVSWKKVDYDPHIEEVPVEELAELRRTHKPAIMPVSSMPGSLK